MTSTNNGDLLLLSPASTAWSGAWVWAEPVEKARNAFAFFRRRFDVSAPGTLEIAVTADSSYILFLDGEFVCRGPARAHLDYYLYDTITLEVAPGPHCLAVIAHHIGEVNATVMTGRPGLLVAALVRQERTEENLSTGDVGWTCRLPDAWRTNFPYMMSHFGFWEECNHRKLSFDWMRPAFDDAGWGAPTVIGQPPCPPWSRLSPRDIPLPRNEALEAVQVVALGEWRRGDADADAPSKDAAARERVLQSEDVTLPLVMEPSGDDAGRYLTVDFGRTVSGYIALNFARCAPGQQVDISYDEILTPAKAVNPERSYAHLTDRHLLPGGRCQVSAVFPRGFRYVTLDISGAGAVELTRVWAVEETYPFTLQPAFDCTDDALNGYFHKSALTVQICTTDSFTDCATRERVQWMEDMYMHCRVAAYAFGDTRMLRHALFQAAQNALPDGRINGFMPSERTNCAFASSSVVWLHLLVDYWRFAGDEDIQRLLPTARRLLALFSQLADADGLLPSWPAGQFWDWAPIELEGSLLLTNAAYLWALERLHSQPVFRELLGDDPAARLTALRAAAHRRFWDAERGLYRDAQPAAGQSPIYSQQANTMAVLAGICPDSARIALLRRIIDPANLGPIPIGEDSLKAENRPGSEKIVPMGTLWFAHFLCQALFEAGLNAEALAQMHALWGAYDALPTYPETRIQHGNTFLCHGWAAGPAFLLPAYILGVEPTTRGWDTVRIHPHPADLPRAHGQFATPRGTLTVEWEVVAGQPVIRYSAPPGMEIEILPV